MDDQDPSSAVTHRISIVRVPRRGRLHERAAEAAIYTGATIVALALVALVALAVVWFVR